MAIQDLLPLLTEAIKTAETADVLSPEEWNGLDLRLRAIVLEALGSKPPKVDQ